jgi:hypothetical protein
MKITKTQLQKVIQEELQAELNEAQQSKDIPKLLGWYSQLINTPQEEAQVIRPLLQAILSPSKLPPVQKMKMVADAFEAMGADGGVIASQVRKALQQQEQQKSGPPKSDAQIAMDKGGPLDANEKDGSLTALQAALQGQ